MSDEKLAEAVAVAIAAEFKKHAETPAVCSLGLDRDQHTKEHQFVASIMRIDQKLDSIKWGFLGSLLKTVGGAIIVLVGLGAVAWVKNQLK